MAEYCVRTFPYWQLAFTRPLNDSVAQKRLRRSRIEGYGPLPQARSWLARAAVVSPASAQASWRTGRRLRTPA